MKNLIKNNMEIFIAIVVVVIIAGAVIGGDFIKDLFKGNPVQFDEEALFELMKDRPEAQRELFKQRIQTAKDMLEKDPEDSSAFEIIGFIHDTLGDKETARIYYKEVLEVNPNSTVILNNLANIYNAEKNFKKAEKLYLQITEIDPSNMEAWRDLHELYYYSYELKADQADDILLLGLEKNPGSPQLLAMLAVYYENENNTSEAIKYYQQLISAMPENEAARNELDRLLRK